ncbi:hypothetical protein, partial [Escherichia coli]
MKKPKQKLRRKRLLKR